jgi:hypothetical protein
LPKQADGSYPFPNKQIHPLWLNVYTWWCFIAFEGGYTDGSAGTYTDHKGNLHNPPVKFLKKLEEFGAPPCTVSGSKRITFRGTKSSLKTTGEALQAKLDQGVPILVRLRKHGHINLMIGYIKEGKQTRYIFYDPGGGGWEGEATLAHFSRYWWFHPQNWTPPASNSPLWATPPKAPGAS